MENGDAPKFGLEIAAGFEVGALGALELAFLVVKLCPTVRAGAFDLLEVRRVTCAGRRAVCHLVFLFRSIRPDGLGSWRRRQDGLRMW